MLGKYLSWKEVAKSINSKKTVDGYFYLAHYKQIRSGQIKYLLNMKTDIGLEIRKTNNKLILRIRKIF